MIASDLEEYVRVLKDYSYSHQGQHHRIYRNDMYLVLEKREDWWRLVSKHGKLIWAPKDYLVELALNLQQKKDALRTEYRGSMKARNATHAGALPDEVSHAAAAASFSAGSRIAVAPAPHTFAPLTSAPYSGKSALGPVSAPFKDQSVNAPGKEAVVDHQEEACRRDPPKTNHWPTKEELTKSHQNFVEEQRQLALAKEEPSLLSRKPTKKKDQKLSKKDISLPTLNTYSQPHIDIKYSQAVPKKNQKISKNDISHPLFWSSNAIGSQILPSPPVASTFKPFSDAMLNSDQNMNPLSASKPLLGAASSNRSSRLSLYDGSCSSESLEDILEESHVGSGVKNIAYNDLNPEKNVVHPINGRKASSDERLDSPNRTSDHHYMLSQLSHRNRSNSVDLKSLSKDRLFSDPNDNVVKSSTAGENERCTWRRSLALEEHNQSNNRNVPVQDDFDASHWLDSPPTLPPKKHRIRTSLKDSQVENVKQSNAKISPQAMKRPVDDSLMSVKHDRISRQGSLSGFRQFPHLEDNSRQLLEPRTQLERRGKGELYKAYACANCGGLTYPDHLCQASVQKSIPSIAFNRHYSKTENTPDSSGINAVMTRSYTCIGAFSSTGHSPNSSVRATKKGEQTLNPNGSALKRNDETKRSFKESSTGHVRKSSIRDFLSKVTSRNDSKRQESSSTLGSEGGGKKLPQCPPSPDANHEVKRKLDDNWLEYWYPEYKCSFYYNEVTKEKKWKPPRKHLQRQMPVDEQEVQEGLGHSDGALVKSQPEYSTQRSMTPSSRTSSVGSFEETSSQPTTLHLQPPSIDSHCSSVASSGPTNLGYTSYAASTVAEAEGSYGSSPEVSSYHSRDYLPSGYYSDQTSAVNPQGNKGEAQLVDGAAPSDHLDDHSLYDGPVLPPRPPNGAKPAQFLNSSDGLSASTEPMLHLSSPDESETGSAALREALQAYAPPEGWRKRSCTSRYIFINMANGEKWEATSTDDGKIYFFNTETGDSNWELPEATAHHPSMGGSGNTSDAEEALPQSSPGTPTASPEGHRIVKQGYLMRTLYSREHKKVRKNWSSMYALLVAPATERLPSSAGPQMTDPLLRPSCHFIAFVKSVDDKKTRDEFVLLEPIRVVVGTDKNKSSRSNILSLTNASGTELLLRHDERSVIDDWHSALRDLNLQLVYPSPPASPKKQHHKSGDKDKTNSGEASSSTAATESLVTDQRTIRTKLLGFIKRRPTADALTKKGIIKDSVFGSTIAELCMQEKTKCPLFVLRCINAIEKKDSNLQTAGIYRISGNAALIQTIRYEVEKNNYEVLCEEKDINNLTGALKLFFRELKEPLLPFNTYERFIEWTDKWKSDRRAGDILFGIIKLLPKENLETLMVLLRHLRRVCEFESDNLMNYSNIAIVFGPCLMWPQTTTGRDLMTQAMMQNMVVEGFLYYFSYFE